MYNYPGNYYRRKSCPLCFSERIRLIDQIEYEKPFRFSTHEIQLGAIPELWSCEQCNSWFTQNIFPKETAGELYSKGHSGNRWSQEKFEKQKTIEILNTLKTILKKGSAILDVGCNTGELLDFAKERGCLTAGIELSERSRSILNAKNHQSYETLDCVRERFDVIASFDLIEHLYDVPGFFEKCKDLLTDHGVIVLLTGNIASPSAWICRAKWWYLKYPEHIVFPSRKYYSMHTGLLLEKWIPTYAEVSFKRSPLSVAYWVVRRMLRQTYIGLPSLGPDHVLIVMKR